MAATTATIHQQILEEQQRRMRESLQQNFRSMHVDPALADRLNDQLNHNRTVKTTVGSKPVIGAIETSVVCSLTDPCSPKTPGQWHPPVMSVEEDSERQLVVSCPLPGYSKKNIGLKLLEEGELCLSATQETQEAPLSRSGVRGLPIKCQRQFKQIINVPKTTVPSDIDAEMMNSVLFITVNKWKEDSRTA
eukprot:TRINITY_DN3887_c0_g1_i1.p1 TRINITY_DN3887_c0_g1~~TRINITY_DN3887_c0_g1_i1.p1  ORF type:complete len:191 (+),score=11.83 TRINITY_DN3887_c0_g1_i1:45-617(+)